LAPDLGDAGPQEVGREQPEQAAAAEVGRLLAISQRRVAILVVGVRLPRIVALVLLVRRVAVVRGGDKRRLALGDDRQIAGGAEDPRDLLDEQEERPQIEGRLAPVAREVALDVGGGRQRRQVDLRRRSRAGHDARVLRCG
jgi:hypothetical protein